MELDEYIRGFDALCRSKEVTLMGRIAEGTSKKKQLLKEANFFNATVVVVGVEKRLSSFWLVYRRPHFQIIFFVYSEPYLQII